MAAQQVAQASEDQVWRRGAWLGLATAAAVVALRLVAWFLTHSLAVLADTVDPLLNLAAATVTLFVLHSARRPADDVHPFGYRALEHVAVGAQGALALAGAGVVAWAAVHQWQAAVPVRLTVTAGVVFVASIALNAIVGRWQLLTGRRIGSPALRAAGRHAQLDAAVGLAVLVHLFVNSYQHHPWLDAGLGLVILGWVAVHALRLLRVAASGLIETARPVAYPRAEAALEALLDDEIVGFHDLRCRDSGGYTYADFHIQFAPGTTLERAHELTTTAELAVQQAIGRCDAIGHLETAAEV
ncbi:MAG TPA: hypothetical protein DCZ72_08995, partial [Armatimonadetes bacterium]|nr:hypothetical protein [Armatimonadota bacterium]